MGEAVSTNLAQLIAHGFAKLTGAQRQAGATQPLAATASNTVVLPSGDQLTNVHVGLPNTDNTSDADKPVSTAQQTALNAKVTGPASATDNTLPRFDGTTGKLLQGSGVAVDDSNNVGLGVTPSAWAANTSHMQFSFGSVGNSVSGYPELLNNAYESATNVWRYTNSGLGSSRYEQRFGTHVWSSAPIGTAGNTITWSPNMTLNSSGNLTLSAGTFGYGAGAGGTGTVVSAAVTVSKPSGQITFALPSLSPGGKTFCQLNNSFIGGADTLCVSMAGNTAGDALRYRCAVSYLAPNVAYIMVENISAGTYSDSVSINFVLVKGSTT